MYSGLLFLPSDVEKNSSACDEQAEDEGAYGLEFHDCFFLTSITSTCLFTEGVVLAKVAY